MNKNIETAMYKKGYDCAIYFSYIPDFKNAKEKTQWEAGYKDGLKNKFIKKGLIND